MLSNFGPSQGPKGLENGLFWDDKWLKNGSKPWDKWLKSESKPWFSKHDPGPVVVPKRMNTAHFEPHLSRSHPLSGAYLICR